MPADHWKGGPGGEVWFHEIKYDGYRLRLERAGDRVRLITKGGNDWTKRFPWIVENELKNRVRQFVVDGEAIIRGVDGYSDFNALNSGKHNADVELLDILALDGDDLRDLPPSMRKTNLQRLLAKSPAIIFVSAFRQGENSPDLFRKACEFGFGTCVDALRPSLSRGGRCPHSIKSRTGRTTLTAA